MQTSRKVVATSHIRRLQKCNIKKQKMKHRTTPVETCLHKPLHGSASRAEAPCPPAAVRAGEVRLPRVRTHPVHGAVACEICRTAARGRTPTTSREEQAAGRAQSRSAAPPHEPSAAATRRLATGSCRLHRARAPPLPHHSCRDPIRALRRRIHGVRGGRRWPDHRICRWRGSSGTTMEG